MGRDTSSSENLFSFLECGCCYAKALINMAEDSPYITIFAYVPHFIVQELCESRGGRPGLSVLTSLLVSVDVKIY